jgi:hypothetical protein
VERAVVSAAAPTLVPAPPDPFDPLDHVLAAGTVLHRVHGRRAANVFNPGMGGLTRFAPLHVPTLYAAQSAEVAVSETLLHDVPLEGGMLRAPAYIDARESTLSLMRELKLCKLMGDGLRRLGISPQDLTATNGDVYGKTVLWAQAAHARPAGFDGIAWMSARDSTSQAYMFSGERATESDLRIDHAGLGEFAPGEPAFDWLSAYCARVKVELVLS